MTFSSKAIQVTEWKNRKVFSSKGILETESTYNKNGQLEYREFFKNGNVSSSGKYGLLNEVTENWLYFYEDGTLKAKGTYEEYTESLARPIIELIENGTWKYYNNNGILVAEISFDLGEVITFKKYLNEKITMPGIEELINK